MLQAIVMHLELSEESKGSHDEENIPGPAAGLTREIILINRQVSLLARLKEAAPVTTTTISMKSFIDTAILSARTVLGEDAFIVERVDGSTDEMIETSEMLEQAVVNLVSFIVRDSEGSKPIVRVVATSNRELLFAYRGRELSKDIRESFKGRLIPTKTTLSLDLFSTKLLIEKHGGTLDYAYLPEESMNRFSLVLKRT
jgi:hypothetical protein